MKLVIAIFFYIFKIFANIKKYFSWQDLKDFFRRVGEVTYGEAHDRTRCGPGRGVICFERERDLIR